MQRRSERSRLHTLLQLLGPSQQAPLPEHGTQQIHWRALSQQTSTANKTKTERKKQEGKFVNSETPCLPLRPEFFLSVFFPVFQLRSGLILSRGALNRQFWRNPRSLVNCLLVTPPVFEETRRFFFLFLSNVLTLNRQFWRNPRFLLTVYSLHHQSLKKSEGCFFFSFVFINFSQKNPI
jgi:hypothetical protein